MKKCDKYEALFTFTDEKTLNEHIKFCEDCRQEHEKMQRVSELLQEAKPAFKKPHPVLVKSAACFLLLVLVSGVGGLNLTKNQTLTAEEFGFPVDSYGLIMVD